MSRGSTNGGNNDRLGVVARLARLDRRQHLVDELGEPLLGVRGVLADLAEAEGRRFAHALLEDEVAGLDAVAQRMHSASP